MRPATIVHVLPYTGVGGTELATLRLAEVLDKSEFAHAVLCRRDANPALRRLFEHAGFRIGEYDAVEPSYHKPAPFLRAAAGLRQELGVLGADLVHCADMLAAHYCAAGATWARRPILCHVRTQQSSMSYRDRTFLWPVNKFVFVSQHTWRSFGHHVPERKGVVIYDGIEAPAVLNPAAAAAIKADVLREFGWPEGTRIVGMVSRVAPVKDFETLIRAAQQVVQSNPNIRFLAIGDYQNTPQDREYHARLAELLSNVGLAQSFLFTGFRKDVSRMLAAVEVMVLSTHSEGVPLVILEGMAHGKPVIATAVGGIPEVITHGESGLLHAHGDAGNLALQITNVLDDGALAERLSEHARSRVREQFSREAFAVGMGNVYRSMLGTDRV